MAESNKMWTYNPPSVDNYTDKCVVDNAKILNDFFAHLQSLTKKEFRKMFVLIATRLHPDKSVGLTNAVFRSIVCNVTTDLQKNALTRIATVVFIESSRVNEYYKNFPGKTQIDQSTTTSSQKTHTDNLNKNCSHTEKENIARDRKENIDFHKLSDLQKKYPNVTFIADYYDVPGMHYTGDIYVEYCEICESHYCKQRSRRHDYIWPKDLDEFLHFAKPVDPKKAKKKNVIINGPLHSLTKTCVSCGSEAFTPDSLCFYCSVDSYE